MKRNVIFIIYGILLVMVCMKILKQEEKLQYKKENFNYRQKKYVVDNVEKCFKQNNFQFTYDNISVSKCYVGQLNIKEEDRLLEQLAKSMEGNILFREYDDNEYDIRGKNVIRAYGYSNKLANSINHNGKLVNFNIVLTYSDEDNKTYVYLGSPVVNIDY